MTIDIIAAAQSEREDKIGQLQTCRDQVRKLTDEAIRLQLDVIEIEAFIAKARSYAGDGEAQTDADMGTVSDDGASPAQGTDGGRDAASTEPNGGGSHETIESTAQDIVEGEPSGSPVAEEVTSAPVYPEPAPQPKTKKQLVLECHQEHPDWWATKIADHLGLNIKTVTGAASLMGLKLAKHPQGGAGAINGSDRSNVGGDDPRQKPRAAAAAGTKFRLKHPDSKLYLHESLTRDGNKQLQVTAYKEFAWCQPEEKLLKVRQLHPETADWAEEAVING